MSKPQRQDSLAQQLSDLALIARREGMYDAQDFIIDALRRVMQDEAGDVVDAAEHAVEQREDSR